jgi:hypothetical protein
VEKNSTIIFPVPIEYLTAFTELFAKRPAIGSANRE